MEIYPLSSGMFVDSYRSIKSDTPSLASGEKTLATKIREKLDTSSVVTVVDLGAMMATSMIVLGTHFRPEVEAGKLKLIATNKQDVEIGDLIHEAERRASETERRMLPDHQTIEFVRRNNHLVQYLPKVDSAALDRAVDQVDIIHERSGGFRFATAIVDTLNSVSATLSMTGQIMTTEYLHGWGYVRRVLTDLGIFHQPSEELKNYLFYKKG